MGRVVSSEYMHVPCTRVQRPRPWPTVISGIKHSIMILYTSLILENALSTSLRNLCDLDSCPCISLKVDHHNECFLNVTPVTDLLNLDRFEAHSDKSYTHCL